LRAAHAAQEALYTDYTGPYPEIFANPHLRFQFRRIWAELSRAARLGESFLALLESTRANLVVFGYDGFIVERTLAALARGRGVPTVGLIHGGLTHTMGMQVRAGDADHFLVWGEEDVRGMTRCGVSPDRIRIVGSMRHGVGHRPQLPIAESARVEARRRLGLPEERPVVLMLTSDTLGMSAPIADLLKHRQTWRDLLSLATRRPDLTFVIKPHPGWDHYEFYRRLCAGGPPNLVFLYDATLGPCVEAAAVAVLVNAITTAALDAMLLGVPVVYLRGAIYPVEATKDPLQDGAVILAHDVAAFESVLQDLLSEGDFRHRALAAFKPFLAYVVGEDPRPAAERVLDECGRIALPASPSTDAEAVLGQVHSGLAAATDLLRHAGDRADFPAAWKGFVQTLRSALPPPPVIRRTLFNLSCDVGEAASSPAELRNLVRSCFRTARAALSLAATDGRNMLVNAYLMAIARRFNAGQGEEALLFLSEALQHAPRAFAHLVHSPHLRQAFAQTLDQTVARPRALQDDLMGLRRERQSLAELCQARQHELAHLQSSWTWKMARLLVRPGRFLKKVIRGRPGRPAD
jgi:hypothetical protein